MTCQTRKPTKPTFDDVDQTCGIIDDVAYADLAGDAADACAELLLWLLAGRYMASQPGSVANCRAKKKRVGACCASVSVSSPDICACGHVRACRTDVGSSPEFHQWIALVFPYTMVCIKTCFDNFDFWVRIKHPLFQEQAPIPVVRKFQKSNTHQIYVVRQISYSTELLVCINQLKKQYKQ
jgi:hypothetical protein